MTRNSKKAASSAAKGKCRSSQNANGQAAENPPDTFQQKLRRLRKIRANLKRFPENYLAQNNELWSIVTELSDYPFECAETRGDFQSAFLKNLIKISADGQILHLPITGFELNNERCALALEAIGELFNEKALKG